MPPPSSRAAQRVGVVLKGKWRLDALIGVGGMATVYSATHRNGSRVAIKLLNPEYSAQPDSLARFMREGYVANKINHPGSVLVLDDDTDEEGNGFLVMELLTGHSLERYARRGAAKLPLEHILHIGERVLDLLAVAHRHGILHRDIKPANIQMTAEGLVKVLDFGIARLGERTGDASATQTGASLGTPSYMPPEQARGRWNMVDPRTDLWALGATMQALILGERPRRAETVQEEMLLAMTAPLVSLRETAPQTPPAVIAIIEQATAFEMDARWNNALAMQHAIRELATVSTFGAPPRLGSVPPQAILSADPASASGPRPDTARMVPPSGKAEGGSSTFHATEHTASPAPTKPRSRMAFVAGAVGLMIVLGVGVLVRVALSARGTSEAPPVVAAAAPPPPSATSVSTSPAGSAAAQPVPQDIDAVPSASATPPPRPSAVAETTPSATASAAPVAAPAPVHHHAKPAPSASIFDERF